jgi:hypothetical protein
MQKKVYLGSLVLLGLALLAGCSGSGMSTFSTNSPGSVTLSIRDTPSNISVISFEITVISASLIPTDNTRPNVQLVTKPIQIELEKLETETAFLSTANVSGTFSSLQVTFANPELTFKNTGTMPIADCAPGAVCEVKPTLNSSSASVSFGPSGLTLSPSSPIGLVLDLNQNASIQGDLSITPTISVAQIPAVQPTGELEEIEDLTGTISGNPAPANNQFTLVHNTSGQSFTISVDSSSMFEDFNKVGCAANNFSCLKPNQVVEVDVKLMANGATVTLVAKEIELEGDVNEQEIEGTISKIDSATQFEMVVLDEEPAVSGVGVGNLITVTIQPGASFQIDSGQLSVGGFSFASSSDLLVGQEVQVRPSSATATVVTTDRVRLKMSQFTATVASVTNASTFVVNTQPGSLLANAGISQIQVQTSSQTEFEGVTGVSALVTNDAVSLRGLLFGPASGPTLVAKKVRKR